MSDEFNPIEITSKCDLISGYMKHLSHPKRLVLLCNLLGDKKTVNELADIAEMGQSQTSQNLKRMELEGLLESEKEGNFNYYRIKDHRIEELMRHIKQIFCSNE